MMKTPLHLDLPFELDTEAYEELGPSSSLADLKAIKKVVRRNRFILEALYGELLSGPGETRYFSFWSRVLFDPDHQFRFSRAQLKIKFFAGPSCVRRLYPEEITEPIAVSARRDDAGFSIESGRKDPAAMFTFDYQPRIRGMGAKLDDVWWTFSETIKNGGIASCYPLYVLVECSEGASIAASIRVNALLERADGSETLPLRVRRKLDDLIGKVDDVGDVGKLGSASSDVASVETYRPEISAPSRPRDRPETTPDDDLTHPRQAPAPEDLLMKVTTRPVQGGLVLDYELTSPSGHLGIQSMEAESERLPTEDLRTEHIRLFAQLEGLLGQLGADGEPLLRREIEEELQAVGHDLYLRLLPDSIKQLYRQRRDRIRSLMVLTDEPWIPWELVRPDEFDDDDFLCMRFPMARWHAGETPPARAMQIAHLLSVEAAEVKRYPFLPAARAEQDRLAAWVDQIPGLTGDFLSSATHSALVDGLEKGGFDWFHFAGHADYEARAPDRSHLVLTDRPFQLSKLTGPILRRIQQDRPLVFLDACRVAREGLALTGVGGWPDRWVRRGHCGGLLSPQWVVRDSSAAMFSEAFYHHLHGGATLGRAVLEARRLLREAAPFDPTYLAYSLYGHPNAIVGFGDPNR